MDRSQQLRLYVVARAANNATARAQAHGTARTRHRFFSHDLSSFAGSSKFVILSSKIL